MGGEAAFTLDPVKVRERVAVFCEQDSLFPFYRCLQALIRVSKGDIFIQRQEGRWEVAFQWPEAPPGQAFDDLLNLGTTASFDTVGHRVGQHLFFGLSAALGTPNYRMTWAGPQAQFSLQEGKFEVLEPVDGDYTKLTFSMESGWWKRLLGISSDRQIAETIKYRLSYSPTPIHMEQELIVPTSPEAPEKPWSAKLSGGSELGWRFLRVPDQNDITVPYPKLDYYRTGGNREIFHLIREPETGNLPLSVAFHDPGRKTLVKGQTKNLSLSLAARAHSAIFLSLETGRQDWLIPMSDGVLTEAVPVDIAGGGIVCLTSERRLNYDLSGLKVVENQAFEDNLKIMQQQSKALKRQLATSLAAMSVRAKTLPRRYDQALSYLVGGPYAGLLGGRFGPKIRGLFSGGES